MQVQIAVFGKIKEIVDTLERVINNNEKWKAFCTSTQEELKWFVAVNKVQIVLYSSGIGASELEGVEEWINTYFPTIKQIHHYGGGSGLLKCEIDGVLAGIDPISKLEVNLIG
ncbi:hypothetical protein IF128_07495 [Empedobacter stercoris]|uniref:hypothetical protein n=1 Tax=Empedobacter stercoris TaxID=1628248 RepID=UPI00166278AD|nr:hypothetical protein [Empedobacter stercoris]MCA4809584.1 hypothetical protein [Empedobacter stercoris]QNT13508.1 hypothetical protein HNV03_01795 [Empedobacter stercoris]